MRRPHDRRPNALFRGAELSRLLTLVAILGVLALLMSRARDPTTWRWLAPSEDVPLSATADATSVTYTQVTPGSTDLDPQELGAASEEFQTVTDRAPLAKDEMPAYWRLVEWQSHQSADQMLSRADRSVTFNDLWHAPEKWRGKLVTMPVHLNQVIVNKDLAENPLGLKKIYEVYGWNADSNPNWFMMVTPELPGKMPSSRQILQEGTFVGYFLKLQPYEDRAGKSRAAPLLIGRMIWHPGAGEPPARHDEWTWPWIAAAGLAVLAAARWGLHFLARSSTSKGTLAKSTSFDEQKVTAWLGQAEAPHDDERTSVNNDTENTEKE